MRSLITVIAVVAAGVLAAAALAANPNFHQGPTCSTSGTGTTSTSTTCSGTLYGVGVQDIDAKVTVSGFAIYTCSNKGGNTAPGQNQVTAGPSTSNTSLPATAAVNGHLSFTTSASTLSVPPTVSGAAAGCPNGNWNGTTPHVTVTSVELVLSQGGTPFYDCTASNPNGVAGSVTLPTSC